MATILALHGPNLNLLGTREPEVYGSETLEDINQRLTDICIGKGHHLQSLQSNAEYELIDRIHDAKKEGVNFIIFNPAAFTHTSIALRDARLDISVAFFSPTLFRHACICFLVRSPVTEVTLGYLLPSGVT